MTRQPRVAAAWTAKPPQPVPISSTWSSGPSSQLLADPLELGDRGLLERHPLALEQRAGVHHRRVEHPLEQLVAEVVVGGDVAAAALRVLRLAQRAQPLARRPQRRGQAPDAVDQHGVAGRQADHRDEIGRVPHALRCRTRPGRGCRASASARSRGRAARSSPPARRCRTCRRAVARRRSALPTRIWRSSSARPSTARALTSRGLIAPAPFGVGVDAGAGQLEADRVAVDQGQHAGAWRAGSERVSRATAGAVSSRRRIASVASNTVSPSRRLSMWTDSVGPGVGRARRVDVVHAHERRDVQLLGEAPATSVEPAPRRRARRSGARPTGVLVTSASTPRRARRSRPGSSRSSPG